MTLSAPVVMAMVLVSGAAAAQGVRISVDPYTTRAIRGISELDRTKYFGLCDHGRDFDRRCKDEGRYEWLVHENGITFGRKLGLITGPDRWGKAVREDADRPGYADLGFLASKLRANGHDGPSGGFREDTGGRLDVACHGSHGSFPVWMGQWRTPEVERDDKAREKDWLPGNIDAAAELSAAVLGHDFNDFDRPAFYEPVNEPHWSYWDEEHFQQWHLKTMEAVRAAGAGDEGGRPVSVGALLLWARVQELRRSEEVHRWHRLRAGLLLVPCVRLPARGEWRFRRADHEWTAARICAGPGAELHGQCLRQGSAAGLQRAWRVRRGELVEALAAEHFPGTGFDWEMRKRGIDDFNMVSSVLANTLVFIDHPHVVAKAVPFILLESMAWDPEYYSVLYTPRDYEDKTDWIATQKILFYRFLRDLRGRRVKASCPDADLQMRAFVDGRTLQVVVNNLWTEGSTFSIDAPDPARITLRRLGRREDFTPYLVEEEAATFDDIAIDGRAAVLVRAEYREPLAERATVDEIPCYGDRIATPVNGEATFLVTVPDVERLDHAVLRAGVSRPMGSDYRTEVRLNGTVLETTVEGCAPRIETEKLGLCLLQDR